jgi:hypothetical protein
MLDSPSGAITIRLPRGNSSVGRAQPCQGWGREFESRFPLQFSGTDRHLSLYCLKGSEITPHWLGGRVAMQWIANPCTSVRLRAQPPFSITGPGGEIGRRKGLKIPRDLSPVPVRLRPRAPFIPLFLRNAQNVISFNKLYWLIIAQLICIIYT